MNDDAKTLDAHIYEDNKEVTKEYNTTISNGKLISQRKKLHMSEPQIVEVHLS